MDRTKALYGCIHYEGKIKITISTQYEEEAKEIMRRLSKILMEQGGVEGISIYMKNPWLDRTYREVL